VRGSSGAAVVGAGLLIVSTGPDKDTGPTIVEAIGGVLVLGGLGLVVAGSIYEIGTAPRAARQYNHRAAKRPLFVLPGAVGADLGLSVAGSF